MKFSFANLNTVIENMNSRIIKHINITDKQATSFYFHPWELDPEQPRQTQASFKSRFRHYLNLNKTEARLQKLLEDFQWDRIDQVFLSNINKRNKQ